MRRALFLVTCLALVCARMASPAAAQSVQDIVFSEVEKRIIREYFDADLTGQRHGKGKGKDADLPPGLAKKANLPPGLAKQLRERGTLPPGIAGRNLPTDLEIRLPYPAAGTRRVIVGNDVVLIRVATRKILDVLFDVVAGQAR